MTLTEWRDHLETLGPDLSLWPANMAEAGIALMHRSDAAKDLFARVSLEADALARQDPAEAVGGGEDATPSPGGTPAQGGSVSGRSGHGVSAQ